METRTVTIEQNGGEYYGTVKITSNNLIQIDDKTVEADRVIIEFDEKIELY